VPGAGLTCLAKHVPRVDDGASALEA
jgi:hypothetical protein